MLSEVMVGQDVGHGWLGRVLDLVEYVSIGIEVLAVAIIVVSIVAATVKYLVLRVNRGDVGRGYRSYREQLGSGLLLGLELLVAADIVRTVSQAPSLNGVLILGLIVLIRTFLSITLEVELEGVWPWQRSRPGNRRGLTRGRGADRGGSPRGW